MARVIYGRRRSRLKRRDELRRDTKALGLDYAKLRVEICLRFVRGGGKGGGGDVMAGVAGEEGEIGGERGRGREMG